MKFKAVVRSEYLSTSLALALIVALPYASNTQAAAGVIEEIVVTAQRTEQGIQEVPMAVSAFTGTMLEDKQILAPSDLQMNTPNVTFSATNFGGSNFSIRGVGRLVTGGSADDGVSTHVNGIAIPTNLGAVEFYDMERVEVLRGPQGTLYGKNATGGVVNLITAKPNIDAVSGNIDAEYGSDSNERFKGAINVPIMDSVAIRVAGMTLKRDGYIENTAYGQVGCARGTGPAYAAPCDPVTLSGIDDDMDGRDLYTWRATALWDITENANVEVMYSKFHENDDRVRITNQICKRTQIPARGCEPDAFGFDSINYSSNTGGIYAALNQIFLLGLPDPPGGFPRFGGGLREQHTDFEPVFKFDEELWEASFNYDFDKFSIEIDGGYQTTEYLAQQDYNMDVGWDMPPTAQNPGGLWPVSSPAGPHSEDWSTSSACNWNDGTSGIFGGCLAPGHDPTRFYSFDQADSETTNSTFQVRVHTHFDGRLNFLIGANYSEGDRSGNYHVASNALDQGGFYGVPLLGFPPLYPTIFAATGAPNGGNTYDSTAVFGEVYFQFTDSIKLTAGLRYNDDNKEVQDSSIFYNSLNGCFYIPDLLGCSAANPVVWQRSTLAGLYGTPVNPSTAPGTPGQLLQYYGLYDEYNAGAMAAAALFDPNLPPTGQSAAYVDAKRQTLAVLSGVPLVPGFSEQRRLSGSPEKANWQETTGRVGIDWQINESSMVYGFYTRGYKPGGFNGSLGAAFVASGAAKYTFDPEKVDAYEIGSKNTLFDNSLVLNVAAFYYKYGGLQVSKIVKDTGVVDNIDANIWGVEIESIYIPRFLPNLTLNLTYGYLNTAIDNAQVIDPLERGAGDPNFITLKNIDSALAGVSYVADAAALTPAFVQQAYAQCGALASAADGNANTTCTTLAGATRNVVPVADGTVYPSGIPVFISQRYLNARGVFNSDGLPTDVDGNQLPNSPENTVSIGAAYSFNFPFGTITPRVDYAWMDDAYAREFNTVGDEIPSWDQWNASLLYTSPDGRWEAKGWIRNINDDDNITGKYLTSDNSGFYRNYFLTEPRIYGASVKYNFGALQ